jgi:hypothetical protein
MRRLPCLALALAAFSGCGGTALMQTARTLPRGEVGVELGASVLYNAMVEERGFALSNLPQRVGMRFGLTDRLELGARSFLGLGLLAGAKYNLLPADSRFALSLMASAGGGTWLDQSALHVPVDAIASVDLGPWTPYGSVGFGAWWFFVPEASRAPGSRLAERTGTGDGVVGLRLGSELRVGQRVALLLEYGYSRPMLDDPGDSFALATNHQVTAGVRF